MKQWIKVIFVLFLFTPTALAEEAVLTFQERVDEAMDFGYQWNVRKSSKLFEVLIKDHPREWFLYDQYTEVLSFHAMYEEAGDVYRKLQNSGEDVDDENHIKERIELFDAKLAFQEDVAELPPWSEATVFGSLDAIIKTNLLEDQKREVGEKLSMLIQNEKKILNSILEEPFFEPPAMNIFIVSRLPDYFALIEERKQKGKETPQPRHRSVYEDGDFIFHYDGEADWSIVAKEVALHMLPNYAEEPSLFLQTAFQNYIALKLQKKSSPQHWADDLSFIKELEVGAHWDDVMQLFTFWDAVYYVEAVELEKDDPMAPWIQKNKTRIFEMMAWSFVHYIVEAGTDSEKKFFEALLELEREPGQIFSDEMKEFFQAELTPEEIQTLSKNWAKHSAGLTFGNVLIIQIRTRSHVMVDVNEYFDGKVKSFVVNSSQGKRTVGVMAPGEYEFDASAKETMTVVSGVFSVWFPGEDDWEEFGEGASFDVPANSKFKVKVSEDTAYRCDYE